MAHDGAMTADHSILAPICSAPTDATAAASAESVVPHVCAPVRYALMAFGFLNVGLGVAGMFLPVMPTTVFLLMALWAFSRSSVRFHRWLYDHPRFGRPLRDWHAHRVIPNRAKILAVGMMTISWLIVTFAAKTPWFVPYIVAGCLIPIALFIVTRPGRVAA
jgi:uncharacterized membrane protein YbaN (DUF454 family)